MKFRDQSYDDNVISRNDGSIAPEKLKIPANFHCAAFVEVAQFFLKISYARKRKTFN